LLELAAKRSGRIGWPGKSSGSYISSLYDSYVYSFILGGNIGG
jgi:hypothetical protein